MLPADSSQNMIQNNALHCPEKTPEIPSIIERQEFCCGLKSKSVSGRFE